VEVAAARAAAAAAAAPKYACAPVSQPNASQEYAADATSHVIATQYNCGQEGHISAECPNPKVEGGVKKCYNCGELGHISADCPQPRKEREPRAPRNGDRKGYSEHDDRGGMAKPNRKEERACRICGKIGHLARDCRSAGAKTDKTCRICGKVGHLARDCRSKGAQKGGKGTKRGRDRGPRSASDLDREMDNYHGKADKPGKRAKPTADELDAEMDAYNKAAATGAVAAEA
jgi:cellular nucleic acid-binding protein